MNIQKMTREEMALWGTPEPTIIIDKDSGKVSVMGKEIPACDLCDKKGRCQGSGIENCQLLCG